MTKSPADGRFCAKIMEALDDVEYQRLDLEQEMAGIGRIRSEAYAAVNLLKLEGEPLIEDVDFDTHAYVFGVHYKGTLVSTLRIHHITPEHRVSTTFSMFPDHLNAWLDSGKSLIDPVRLAADPSAMRSVPALPYITLRLAAMASQRLSADYVIQLTTPQHAPFYKRTFFGFEVAAPIAGEKYGIPIGLHATDIAESMEAIRVRFPFFQSTPEERHALFDRSAGRTMSKFIKASARHAMLAAA